MTVTEERPTTNAPAPQRRRRLLVIAGAAAAVIVVGAVYVGGWTSVMGVRTVEVQGASTVDSQQLIDTAGIATGTPMMQVDLRAATARLADLPQVADVEVERVWPRKVIITVTERQAVAMQKSGSGWELLDENGNPFALAPSKPKDLPTIERSADPATNTAMLEVLAAISPEIRAEVVSVSASSPNAVRLTLRDNDAVVNWGSPELSDFKSQVLLVLLQTESGWYDVSNPNTPTSATAPPVPKPVPLVSPSAQATDGSAPAPQTSPEGVASPEGLASPEPASVRQPVASPEAAASPLVGAVPAEPATAG
jgi:cell division protein FtsQ